MPTELQAETDTKKDPPKTQENQFSVELESVNKDFKVGDETLHALSSVNLRLRSGDFVAIIGPSGSGKSTLANIIGGLDKPSSGRVVAGGIDLSRAHDKQLSSYRNKYVGFVFQAFNLQPSYSILDNVMLPLLLSGMSHKERITRAKACLDAVGLGARLKSKPTQLSGGERQRVSIARALANQPSLIIADEPTGNLDSARGHEIMATLQKLNKQGITLIVITHDAGIARQARRLLSIHDGRLTEARQ